MESSQKNLPGFNRYFFSKQAGPFYSFKYRNIASTK